MGRQERVCSDWGICSSDQGRSPSDLKGRAQKLLLSRGQDQTSRPGLKGQLPTASQVVTLGTSRTKRSPLLPPADSPHSAGALAPCPSLLLQLEQCNPDLWVLSSHGISFHFTSIFL